MVRSSAKLSFKTQSDQGPTGFLVGLFCLQAFRTKQNRRPKPLGRRAHLPTLRIGKPLNCVGHLTFDRTLLFVKLHPSSIKTVLVAPNSLAPTEQNHCRNTKTGQHPRGRLRNPNEGNRGSPTIQRGGRRWRLCIWRTGGVQEAEGLARPPMVTDYLGSDEEPSVCALWSFRSSGCNNSGYDIARGCISTCDSGRNLGVGPHIVRRPPQLSRDSRRFHQVGVLNILVGGT